MENDQPVPNYVYCVQPEKAQFMKIGRWRGSLYKLFGRYRTVYGNFDLTVFECDNSVELEASIFNELRSHHYTNELFNPEAFDDFLSYCSSNSKNMCGTTDQSPPMRRSVGPKTFTGCIDKNGIDLTEEVNLVVGTLNPTCPYNQSKSNHRKKVEIILEILSVLGLVHILDYKNLFDVEATREELLKTKLFREWNAIYPLFNRRHCKKNPTFTLRCMTDTLRSVFSSCGLSMCSKRSQAAKTRGHKHFLDKESCMNVCDLVCSKYPNLSNLRLCD